MTTLLPFNNIGDALVSGFIAGSLSFISVKSIGLINNVILSDLVDELFVNITGDLLERITENSSRIIARRNFNRLNKKDYILRFY